ncbi:electron transport complex subunit E [Vogesella sp. GCM10023246]|uniref:Ion-translocating oxidoreductase complex subunit E n=1 Tax=Vogesella oryzagri TaxID=3160864 RepID=A0ABV1LZS4_9NEIS
MSNWQDISRNGLWRQNPGLVQLLGLCPVLAISNNVVNALALGLATTLVTALSGTAVASVRKLVPHEIRNPIFIMIIAALVSCVDLAMNAWLHELYLVLGIFIPLITTNCIVMARAEAFAARNGVADAALDGLMMGLGLTGVLVVLGGLRELLGKGTLLAGADKLFGEAGHAMVLQLAPANYQFLLALLPPGAFLGLGLLIAGKNMLDARQRRIAAAAANPVTLPARQP